MNVEINKLVKTLLQKDTLEQCSLQELEQFADRHPYFGAAQLLLTKKLQTENSGRYDEQKQKTFLFFHNPMWVEHLLNDTGNAEVIAPEKKEDPLKKEENINQEVEDIKQMETAAVVIVETDKPVQPFPVQEKEPDPVLEVNDRLIEKPLVELPTLKPELPGSKADDLSKTELVFEPFYTVDYFASQGIKFKEEEKPRDKFGQQLKSFTDWLKTMKRLPVTEIGMTVASNSEKKVEQLAEHSLAGGEVVTEAMAEVWEKQGNPGKAIEVYNKLSLLDPSKSPYFAAKIEDLKKIN
ncbi:MAG: hypothetical protein ABI688_09390 [Bacteroidota bacterium]